MVKKSGWHEKQQSIITSKGVQNKAPEHYKASIKKTLEDTLRTPMVKSKWDENSIIEELKKLKANIGHFPVRTDIIKNKRYDLLNAIKRNGGFYKFRELLGDEQLKASKGYWIDDIILKELIKIKGEIGHFPTQRELKAIGRIDLMGAIKKQGGFKKFRVLVGDKQLRVPNGYWTDDTILKELIILKDKLGHFPTREDLTANKRRDLEGAINKHGGSNRFRELIGDKIIKVSGGFWTDDTITTELIKIKDEIGHFPTRKELIKKDRQDLVVAADRHGGSNKFREMLGEEQLKAPKGYWKDDIILNEVIKIKNELGHFPAQLELTAMGRADLAVAISRHGGSEKFRKLLHLPSSLEEFSGMGLYVKSRGIKSEKEVKKILVQYCIKKEIPEPKHNVKLSDKNILEFVFEAGCGKRIGIDVVNTQGNWQIRRKYLEKDYHKYLDKLWIVVLSDIFTTEDYIRFNEESPDNVEIMSVWDLIDTLQVDVDEHAKRKLEALETYTLRTKGDLINKLKNRTISEYN